jgi:hypothetical protein
MGVSSSQAADLGGNCCADLEERVAELEATAARKGNRKMGLTISGQVNRVVLWFDDGKSSNAYYGLDNINSSTRFIFSGNAKVTPKVTMGFEWMVEIGSSGRTDNANQFNEDGAKAASSPLGNNISFNQPNGNSDGYLNVRRAAWWIEHADLGKVLVGRYNMAGIVTTIDLANINMPASSSFANVNGGFFLRGSSGQYYNMTVGNLVDPAADQGRSEQIRYDSPTWYGFSYSASLAEAGDYWGTMVRYAGEFNGFQLAAGIGYEETHDRSTPALVDPTSTAFTGIAPDIHGWGAAGSVRHVPTGLFVQGHYQAYDYNAPNFVSNSYFGATGGPTKKDTSQWLIQAGISKNFFGPGVTAVYGEYGNATDFGAESAGRNYAGTTNFAAPFAVTNNFANFTTVNGVTSTDVKVWGTGITQTFDAAATTLYLGWRHFDYDITCQGGAVGVAAAANCGGGAQAAQKLPTLGTDIVIGGARVMF